MLGILTNRRIVTGELMDDPDIPAAEHVQALAGLQRINRVSDVADQIAPPILEFCFRTKRDRISLMDIACGGGDVPIAVARKLQQSSIAVSLIFFDRSSTALTHAASSASAAKIPFQTIPGDALCLPQLPAADIITNSLFLHHLHDSAKVVHFLSSLRSLARGMVIISDLIRSPVGVVGAWMGCRILSRSRIVHHDGPASVRAAWTIEEMRQFAEQAGMKNVTIDEVWPWRMLLKWLPPPGT